MLRTTTLVILPVLAFSARIAAPASAQNVYGYYHGDLAHGDAYGHHNHGHGCHYDSYHQHRQGCSDYHLHGHAAYPITVLSRQHTIPVYAESSCPYGIDSLYGEPNGCPLQRGRALPNRLPDPYQPDFGLEAPRHNHPDAEDIQGGHSHDGHSLEGHSHEPQVPGHAVAPSDRCYLAPPSLPRDSVRDRQPQQDFRRYQPLRDDSIRMDSPPPPSSGTIAPSSQRDDSPAQFNTPPPPTG